MSNNGLTLREENSPAMTSEQVQLVSTLIQQMMAPVMENIGQILERNNQAMERIAATQQMMSARMSDLEKQVRLKTPMSRAQENYINGAVRARARELLESRGFADDKKAVTKLGGMIRRSILTRYGVNSLREAPAYDYETALDEIKFWMDLPSIRDVAKEAKQRADLALESAECCSDADGGASPFGAVNQ